MKSFLDGLKMQTVALWLEKEARLNWPTRFLSKVFYSDFISFSFVQSVAKPSKKRDEVS